MALFAAAAVAAGAFVSFAFGTCHDSGGLCADEFSSTHVEAYAGGVVLAGVAAGCCVWAVRARRTVALAAVLAATFVTALAAVLIEL